VTLATLWRVNDFDDNKPIIINIKGIKCAGTECHKKRLPEKYAICSFNHYQGQRNGVIWIENY